MSEGEELGYEQIMFIPRIMFVIAIMLSIIFMVRYFMIYSVDIKNAESFVLVNRMLYSGDCIIYVDGNTNRPYPGIIDVNRFTSPQLDSCISYGERNDYAAAQLLLQEIATEKNRTVYFNKVGYDVWEPRLYYSGSGGAAKRTSSKYVLLKENNNLIPARLYFSVIMPN